MDKTTPTKVPKKDTQKAVQSYSTSPNPMKDQTEKLSKTKGVAQFKMGDQLGEGSFGVVRLATHILTGERVAVKILERSRIREQKDKVRIEREIRILKSLNHLNIIKLYSVIETNTTQYLIQEYASGKELAEYIFSKKKLDDKEACRYFQQIISGIEYIHKLQIAHRDLKPENMLLTASKDVKIVDFGLSNTYKKGELLGTACGSPCYAAPEMLSGKKYRGITVDIWSCGIILYVMLCGYLPFEDNNNEGLYKKIIAGKFTIPDEVSKSGKDLIKKILETNPKKRITIPEIKKHKWFNIVNPDTNVHCGIDTKKDVIPIDEAIVSDMEKMEYKKEDVRKNVLMNEHNNVTTTYYLLLKKKIRSKIPSVSDLKSEEYDNYMKDERNKMEKYNDDIEQVIKERASSKGILDIIPMENDKEENNDNAEEQQQQQQPKENEEQQQQQEETKVDNEQTHKEEDKSLPKAVTESNTDNKQPETINHIEVNKQNTLKQSQSKKTAIKPKHPLLSSKRSNTATKSFKDINRNKLALSTGFSKDKPKNTISSYISSKLKPYKTSQDEQPSSSTKQTDKTLTLKDPKPSFHHVRRISNPISGYNTTTSKAQPPKSALARSSKIVNTDPKTTKSKTTSKKGSSVQPMTKEKEIKKSLEQQLTSPKKQLVSKIETKKYERKYKEAEDKLHHPKSRDKAHKSKDNVTKSKTLKEDTENELTSQQQQPKTEEHQQPETKKIEAKVCLSPFDLAYVYFMEPTEMKSKLVKILNNLKYKTKLEKKNNLKIHCDKPMTDLQFEVDFLSLPQNPNTCVLKFKRVGGNSIQFKQLMRTLQSKLI